MSARRTFLRFFGRVRPAGRFARLWLVFLFVLAVGLSIRCTRELDPTRGDGGVALTWRAESGAPVASADSARTWVLDGRDRILVGPVIAPFDAETGSFEISLRVPAGNDRAIRMQLEGPGARGRGAVAEGEARGIAVPAAGTAEAHLRLRNAVPRLEPFTGQPGDLRITLRWSSVPGASGYRLFRLPSPGPEQVEDVADTVRVFELTEMARWPCQRVDVESTARGLRDPAVLDTTWFRVSARLRGGALSVASDSVAVSFAWVEDTPRVLAVTPADGAVGVPDSVAVEIVFNRPMDSLSLGDLSVPSLEDPVNLRVDGTMEFVAFEADSIDWLDGGRRLHLRLAVPLRRDARYLLNVTPELRDLDGRPLDQSRPVAGLQGFESRFETEHYNPMRVTAVVPDSGATGVATHPLLDVRLNRKARAASVNSGTVLLADSTGVGVECSVALLQDSIIRVAPVPALRFATRYVLTVTSGVRDLRGRNGEPLDQNPATLAPDPFVTAFRTLSQPTGPRVTAWDPPAGARNVPITQVVRVRFSRPVQAASVGRYDLMVQRMPSEARLDGLFVPSADRTEFQFTTTQFDPGKLYRVMAKVPRPLDPQGNPVGGIRDDLGIPFDQDSVAAGYQDFTSPFRVEECPQVSSVTPAPASKDVPVNAAVVLRFSVKMDRTSVTAANLALSSRNRHLPLDSVVWTADSMQVTLRPAGSFSFCDTVTVFADTSLHSTGGSRLDQEPSQTGYQPLRAWFITVADGISPRVAVWTPGPGAVGVPVDTAVMVRFAKPVVPITAVAAANFLLQKLSPGQPAGPALDATRTITSDSLEAMLRPAAPLENATEYQVTVRKYVQDRCAQQLDQEPGQFGNQDFTSTFHTDIERVPPRVAAVSPDLNERGVSVDATVQVTFNEPMRDDAALTSALTLTGPGGTAVDGSATPSPDGLRLVFKPAAPLRYLVGYEVRVDTTAADLVGNLFDHRPDEAGRQPFTSFFETGPDLVPPRVLAWVPADGDTAVRVTVNPEVTFDEAMAATTLRAGLRLLDSLDVSVALRVEIRDDRRAVLIPIDRLRFAERYTLEANEAARDTSGNGLDQDRVMPGFQPSRVSFRTEEFPPRVAAFFPARDSLGVDPGVVVEVRFAAPVDPATVVIPAFALYPEGSAVPVPGSISSPGNSIFRYTPDAPLAPESWFRIRVTTQVTDRAGTPLDQDPWTPILEEFESGFRTGTPPVAQAGDGVCDPAMSVVTLAASADKPDASLSLAEVNWGDGTAIEPILIPSGQWPAPSHTYPCLDILGCNLEDDDQDGSADETGPSGCDESYRIRLRVRDSGGLWSAWDPTGVSFCNLQVRNWAPGANSGVDTLLTELRLLFTRPLLADSVVAAHFELFDTLGVPVTLTAALASGPDSSHVVILSLPSPPSRLQPGMKYTIRALPGIRSTDGRFFDQAPCPAGVQPFEAVFHTQLRVSPSHLTPSSGRPFGSAPQEGRVRGR